MEHTPPQEHRERQPLGFPRNHRLKRRRLIRPLFERGRSDVGTTAAGSIRILFRVAKQDEVGEDVPIQVGFSPGRKARPAVVRNRVRRLLREVYRVNQHILIDLFRDREVVLTMMILFRGDPVTAGADIPRDLPVVMHRLRERLLEANESSAGGETAA